ncbi:MAG: helix-turn-helix transcriptional regulator [Desulfosporosinus sp.]|nr:helix-turn-helix transcriptional regulator [Desulfosporosinus sp.]
MISIIGTRIKEERNKKGLSQEELGKRFSITQQAVNKWESGKSGPDPEMIKNLADFFECSADSLVGTIPLSPTSTNPSSLTLKDERDVARDIEKILSDLESDESLAFNGEPLDDETKELMRISLENSMRLAVQLAKKKFTPKKYR